MPYKIRMENISKTFKTQKGDFLAVKDVNFDVAEGEFISLVGPSGCGKSTALRMLGGIIEPTTGVVYYGRDKYASGVGGDALRKLGFVFQSPNLFPWLTIRKNMELPLKIFKLSGKEWTNRIDGLLEMTGLTRFADAYPSEISGGMQQRVGVIRAMVHDPEILLMDEPFGALDAITKEQMNFDLLKIWKDTGKTIIFITHSVEEAVLLSSRVFVMAAKPGRITHEIEIDLPRPRTLETVSSPRFIELEETITGLIGEGVA